MTTKQTEPFPPEIVLALAHTPVSLREKLSAALALDRRLAKIVAGTNEPMLGQMRLAWWRDMLRAEAVGRPVGDQVLDSISRHWPDDAVCLVGLVNAWEQMLGEPPLPRASIEEFGCGRGSVFAAALLGRNAEQAPEHANAAAQRWALTDAALHIENIEERGAFLELARALPNTERLKRPFKGLAILSALSMRSLKNDGTPLIFGRGAAVAAWKAAILGR